MPYSVSQHAALSWLLHLTFDQRSISNACSFDLTPQTVNSKDTPITQPCQKEGTIPFFKIQMASFLFSQKFEW